MTHVELIICRHLKDNQRGTKFRRQHLLGIYIADFYAYQHKLIIEIDGSIHNIPEIKINDIERQRSLEADGLKIIRFSNWEVYDQIDKVLAKIKDELYNI